jgi:hypothetical protein
VLATILAAGCPPALEDDCPPGSTRRDALCVPHRLTDPCDRDDDGSRAIDCGGHDCDDDDPAVHPRAGEVCNDRDDDCDGVTDDGITRTWYPDGDGDGFGRPGPTADACNEPDGYAPVPGDCDDGDGDVRPGAAETCDGRDDDCDGAVDEGVSRRWYADADRDGHGDPFDFVDACTAPAGRVAADTDCDDGDTDAHPGQIDWFDEPRDGGGFDYDCDGVDAEVSTAGLADCLDCIAPTDGWLGTAPPCGMEGTRLLCDWFAGSGCAERERVREVMRCR